MDLLLLRHELSFSLRLQKSRVVTLTVAVYTAFSKCRGSAIQGELLVSSFVACKIIAGPVWTYGSLSNSLSIYCCFYLYTNSGLVNVFKRVCTCKETEKRNILFLHFHQLY